MDFDTIFKKMFEEHMKKQEGEPFKSTDEAFDKLSEFINKSPDFEVGDRIERNEVGKNIYAFPKAGQAAICVSLHHGNEENDMLMYVAIAKDNFRAYTVDSRYFQKSQVKNNIFKFRKGK